MPAPTPSTAAARPAAASSRTSRARVPSPQPLPDARNGGPGTAAAIAAQVAGLHGPEAARMAPCLALGIFERVGSNWLSDSLRPVMPQHNEPFRQQLGREHPLSPCNQVPVDLRGVALSALGRHHLACAVSDLYGRPRHLVKETNLFFATDSVLELLPHSPVVVLTRAPLGIASSFERGRLWNRWTYGARYTQVAATARSPRWQNFAPLVPLDDPAPPIALGRLIALNALLLARGLVDSGREFTVVPYEQHVDDRPAVLNSLSRHLGIMLPSEGPSPETGSRAVVDSTFATTSGKTELVAEVDSTTANLVTSHAATTLAAARHVLEDRVTNTAAGWLAGDDRYELRAPSPAAGRPRGHRRRRGLCRGRPTNWWRTGCRGGTSWSPMRRWRTC